MPDSTVTLFCGDCLEYMRGMESGSVDAVVTDPPYGKNWSRGRNAYGTSNRLSAKRYIDWDKNRVGKEYFDAMLNVSSMQIVWGGNYYTDFLPPSNCWLIWDKKGDLDNFVFADAEIAWCSLNKVMRIFRLRNHGFIRDFKDERLHPTQKPLALMTWVIENYTPPGCTIFDPFMGSGTTGVACIQTGRNFIGCEISPEYYAIAERRIAQAQQQMIMPLEVNHAG